MGAAPLAIIVPMLNEAGQFPHLAAHLLTWQGRGCEVLLVDGGSSDQSVSLARDAGLSVLESASGRAVQMNAGARRVSADWLLFLHADSRLPGNTLELLAGAGIADTRGWGRFDVAIKGDSWLLPWIARCMNLRSRLTGIATGDQAMFVRRGLFDRVGGFPEQPLMEDVELSRRLGRVSAPLCLRAKVTTSGRRWQQHGVCRTILLMWQLRFAYWRGVSAAVLARRYG
jgi:rSAM/selenodomain-associated transferase 2